MRLPRILILTVLLLWGISSVAQFNNASGPQAPGTNNPFGGGGINPNDIDPPPDPIDTPFDAGVIFLLIIGTAYGVTAMGSKNIGSIKSRRISI